MEWIVIKSRRRVGCLNTSTKRSAVEARVRRALLRQGEVLRKARCAREREALGSYFTVDPHTGNPERWKCDLEELARECEVMRVGDAITD